MPLTADIELFQQGYKSVKSDNHRLVYENDRGVQVLFLLEEQWSYLKMKNGTNAQVPTSEYSMGLMVAIDHKILELGWVK